MAIIHFNGHFNFHEPRSNNNPRSKEVCFDPTMEIEKVMSICGCNPANYFEFKFDNVTINQVTYDDGEVTTIEDSFIGKHVELEGIKVDVSPSAICSQLFAGNLKISDNLTCKVNTVTQSHLKWNIRSLSPNDDTMSAHFETKLSIKSIDNSIMSRFLEEISDQTNLEIYYNLNNYTPVYNEPFEKRNKGDIYGYIRSEIPLIDTNGLRIKNRRLVAHPNLNPNNEIGQIYLYNTDRPITQMTDIDGSYDILKENRLLFLRYLEFVPFLDKNYTTPDMDKYIIYIIDPINEVHHFVGEFKGNHEEMNKCGGLLVFKIPSINFNEEMMIGIDVIKKDLSEEHLMVESEWDIILDGERGLKIPSGQTRTISAQVFYKNRPVPNHPVNFYTQNQNGRSPIVAKIEEGCCHGHTDNQGKIKADIKAIDLNNTGGIQDPIDPDNKYYKLPMDRYYGNFVYMSISNPLRHTNPAIEEIEFSIRVLHVVNTQSIPLDELRFEKDILPLFSYYIRYFPWLHTFQQDEKFIRFFDIKSHESFSNNINNIIERLSKKDDDYSKMPRSRDFPIGGLEMIKRWKQASTLRIDIKNLNSAWIQK